MANTGKQQSTQMFYRLQITGRRKHTLCTGPGAPLRHANLYQEERRASAKLHSVCRGERGSHTGADVRHAERKTKGQNPGQA